MTAARWLPTFSLHALLAAVAVAAVVVATLLNATPNVKGAAATACFVLYARRPRSPRRIIWHSRFSAAPSPTSPLVDVSACGARKGWVIFPLQRGWVQVAGQVETESLEEDSLVVAGLGHAASADLLAVLGGQHDVDDAEFAQFGGGAPRFVAEAGLLAELAEEGAGVADPVQIIASSKET